MQNCPYCEGTGRTFRFVDYAGGSGEGGYVPCQECAGTGQVAESHIEGLAIGQRLREWRVHTLHESQRDTALRFGLGAPQLAQMEHGRRPIPEALWEAAGLRERAGEREALEQKYRLVDGDWEHVCESAPGSPEISWEAVGQRWQVWARAANGLQILFCPWCGLELHRMLEVRK